METQSIDRLVAENERLRRRLEEAEDAIRAIREGEVDALLVEREREQIYTLESVDKPYRLLVEQMPQSGATLTTDGQIIYCNRRFCELLKRPAHSLFGSTIRSFIVPESRPKLDELLQEGQRAEIQGEIIFERADGTTVPVYMSVTALHEGALGLCLILSDLTDQQRIRELQQTQQALRAASDRLELAQQAGRIGTFDWNIRTGVVNWSATEAQLYGLLGGEFGGRYENWKQTVHPDDLPRVEREVSQAVADRSELITEFRIIRPDGGIRWLMGRAKVLCDDSGEAVQMVGVNLDITEQRRAEAALQDADRRKDEFLATLAHELRNPLAAILNALQVMRLRDSDDPQVRRPRDVIQRQTQQLVRLVDDLLDISRISRGNVQLRKELVDLNAIIQRAVEGSQPAIDANGHELIVKLPPGPLWLNADIMRLSQVFGNLLNNAAKYMEPGGRIWLTAERSAGADRRDEVIVRVKDNGVGIAAEMLPRVFELFTQVDRSLDRSQGGLGIGLSLVRSLLRLHDGTVTAHSDGHGKGSEFIVRLPLLSETPE